MLIIDQNSSEFRSKLLKAKYLEMELGIQNMENIKLMLIDQTLAISSGLIKDPKVNSLHLIRKSNDFTFKNPNRWLFGGIPFHVLENITMYDKKKNMMIQKYLNRV